MTQTILAAIPLVLGVVVMFGWAFDVPAVKYIYPGWESMKFNTAVMFFFAGVMLLSRRLEQRQAHSDVGLVRVTAALALMVLVLVSLWAALVSGGDFVNEFFVTDHSLTATIPGQPSTATMIAFFLLSVGGLAFRGDTRRICGWLVLLIGSAALLGYFLWSPLMFFETSTSTAMSVHTAAGLAVAGYGMVERLGKKDDRK